MQMERWTIPNSPTGKSFEAFEPTPGCISVAVTPWSPAYVNLDTRPFSGIHLEIFRMMMQYLGWCYHLVVPEDLLLGTKINNTYHDGALGMLARREVDMVMGPVAVHTFRSEILNFAPAYMYNKHYFIYRRVTRVQPDVLIFTRPFGKEVWIWVLASLLFVGALTSLLHLARSYSNPVSRASSRRGRRSTYESGMRGFTWALKIFLSQDFADAPGGGSGRMLGAFWLFICFMIASIYRCNLQAILVNEKIKVPFNSVEEFLDQDEFKLTWINGTLYGDSFQLASITDPGSLRARLWTKRDCLQPNAQELVKVALEGKVAVMAPDELLLGLVVADFTEFGDCRLALTLADFPPKYMTFGYPKNSPLQDAMDQMMLRVIQSGMASHLQQAVLRKAFWCTKPQTNLNEPRPFAPKHFFGLFVIYAIGVTIAFVVLIIEIKLGSGAEKRTDVNG
ncbi:Ionotropic receptor 170 [Hyalella azteca]|uniref:Ionotropic receptor 170 n=1 Tax=Hyalella azteca TaxID=294128 RepID=A0A6A0GZE6_HYAAZ|nr:Ionotropic receptor 170 [Hyalella azteca]